MKGAKKILTILWKCWFIMLTSVLVIIIGVFWTFPFAFSNKTFPIAYKGIRLWAILIFYGSGFRLELTRNQQLNKDQPYIFISNHSSILDIMIMALIHKHHPIVFVGKEELAKLPIFGPIYRRICITVDRSNTQSRTRVFKLAKEKINSGQSIVIYPEGGIPNDESITLQKFKDGAFTIAISTQVPIVVYAFKGIKEIFPWSWTHGYPGTAKVRLIDIIPTENLSLHDKTQIKDICYKMIDDELNKDN